MFIPTQKWVHESMGFGGQIQNNSSSAVSRRTTHSADSRRQVKQFVTGASNFIQKTSGFFSSGEFDKVSDKNKGFSYKSSQALNSMFKNSIGTVSRLPTNVQKIKAVNDEKTKHTSFGDKTSTLENLKPQAVKTEQVVGTLAQYLKDNGVSEETAKPLARKLVEYTQIKNDIDNKEINPDSTQLKYNNDLGSRESMVYQENPLTNSAASPLLSDQPNETFGDQLTRLETEINDLIQQQPEYTPEKPLDQLTKQTTKFILREELGLVREILNYSQNEAKAEIAVGVVQLAGLAVSLATGGVGAVAAAPITAIGTSAVTQMGTNVVTGKIVKQFAQQGTGAFVKNVTDGGQIAKTVGGNESIPQDELAQSAESMTIQEAMQLLCLSLNDLYLQEASTLFDANGNLTPTQSSNSMSPQEKKTLNQYIQTKIALSNVYYEKQLLNDTFVGMEGQKDNKGELTKDAKDGADEYAQRKNSLEQDEAEIRAQMKAMEADYDGDIQADVAELFTEILDSSLTTQQQLLEETGDQDKKSQLYELFKFVDMMRGVEGKAAGLFELTVSAGDRKKLQDKGYR